MSATDKVDVDDLYEYRCIVCGTKLSGLFSPCPNGCIPEKRLDVIHLKGVLKQSKQYTVDARRWSAAWKRAAKKWYRRFGGQTADYHIECLEDELDSLGEYCDEIVREKDDARRWARHFRAKYLQARDASLIRDIEQLEDRDDGALDYTRVPDKPKRTIKPKEA